MAVLVLCAQYGAAKSKIGGVLLDSMESSKSVWGRSLILPPAPLIQESVGPRIHGTPILMEAMSRWGVPALDAVVMEGFVSLGENFPYVGSLLKKEMKGKVAVVCWSKHKSTGANAIQVHRGEEKALPLYLSSSKEPNLWAELFRRMDGPNRIPTMVRRAELLTR